MDMTSSSMVLLLCDDMLCYVLQIVHMIRDRLILPSNYAAVKVAGLYLLSDILHNAGAPIKHAAGYRTLVQSVLPVMLDDLRDSMRKATGRMSAYHVRGRCS